MIPKAGTIVLFHSTVGGEPHARASVITRVNDDGTVNLAVLQPTDCGISAGGPEGTTPTDGCWTYLPVEEPPVADEELLDGKHGKHKHD